jgi:hypothetical protein
MRPFRREVACDIPGAKGELVSCARRSQTTFKISPKTFDEKKSQGANAPEILLSPHLDLSFFQSIFTGLKNHVNQ